MRVRSFIIAYILILAILLFADRRPGTTQPNHYSYVVDLTNGQSGAASHGIASESKTRIIAPAALIPGTWAAGQIPPERLIAPLVVMDLNVDSDAGAVVSLDDIAAWESRQGMIPQGAVVAIRRANPKLVSRNVSPVEAQAASALPIADDAAKFLMEARYTIGFAVETRVDLKSDRTLARQLALHGNYVVEKSAGFAALPPTGSLIIVAPSKDKNKDKNKDKDKVSADTPVRILAMVR
jgi:kynurenine formamidase